jgi:Carboxypeptidase regulatory-like domain/TonB dependent receptor
VNKYLVLLFFALPLAAQIDRAAITGMVTDPSGSPVAGAAVAVKFPETGLERSSVSNSSGVFLVSGIPIGRCVVTVVKDGFRLVQSAPFALEVGDTRTLDVRLEVAGVETQIQVTGEASPLTRNSAEVGGVMQQPQVQSLPLNGRSWAALMALIPGAIDTGANTQKTIRFNGRSNDENNFRMDGVDASGIIGQSLRVGVRLQVSTEAIAEFRVNSALYTAEQGGAPGGQIDIVSRGGTNDWHGSAFDFLRNSAMDARSPFDGASPPPFRLNQFGSSLGGPAIRNRAFFFLNYEGIRQSLGQTLTGFVPSNSFRTSASAGIAPFLQAFPVSTVATSDPTVARYTSVGSQISREDEGFFRFDYRFTDATTAMARFSIDDAENVQPNGDTTGTLLDRLNTLTRPMNGSLQLMHVFSPTLINEVKAGVNRVGVRMFQVQQNALPYALKVPGYTTLLNPTAKVQSSTSYSLVDNATWIRGRHTWKAGVEIRRVEINQGSTTDGTLTYANRTDFQNNALNTADITGDVPTGGLRETQYFGYAQDEWKVRSNLTVNAGLRYEFYNAFHEALGRDLPFDIGSCGAYCPYGSAFYYPGTTNFAPRLSLAWSPKSLGGKTVLRAGAGIYYGEGQLGDLNSPIFNLATRLSLARATVKNLSYPLDPFIATSQAGLNTPKGLLRNRKQNTIGQWGFSVQHEILPQTIIEADYIGSSGWNLYARSDLNLIDPATGKRPLPQYGMIDFKKSDAISHYNGLNLSMKRQFSQGWLMGVNYLWSHAINDGSVGGSEGDYPQNINCRSCERSDSDQDIRHNFNVNTVYRVPLHGNFLMRDWEFSSIASARTGRAINVTVSRSGADLPDGNSVSQRPDVVAGVSLIPSGGQTVNNWINAAAFAVPAKGTWGNAGRNLVRGPGLWQADVGLSRHFPVHEKLGVEFRAELFNIFNRAQYGDPQANLSSPATFGQITTAYNTGPTGTGTPRQLQLMIKLLF